MNKIEVEIDRFNSMTISIPEKLKMSEFFTLLDRTRKIMNASKIGEIMEDNAYTEQTTRMDRNRPVRADHAAMRADFANGMTVKEVATKYGKIYTTVYSILHPLKVAEYNRRVKDKKVAVTQPVRSYKNWKRLDQAQENEVIQMYRRGDKVKDIASKLGMKFENMKYIIHEMHKKGQIPYRMKR